MPRIWNYYRPTDPATWVGSRDASASKKVPVWDFVLKFTDLCLSILIKETCDPHLQMKPSFLEASLSHVHKQVHRMSVLHITASGLWWVWLICKQVLRFAISLPTAYPHTHCKFSNSIIKFTLWLSLVPFLMTYGRKRVMGQIVLFLHFGVQRSLQHPGDRALWAFDCEDKNCRLSI